MDTGYHAPGFSERTADLTEPQTFCRRRSPHWLVSMLGLICVSLLWGVASSFVQAQLTSAPALGAIASTSRWVANRVPGGAATEWNGSDTVAPLAVRFRPYRVLVNELDRPSELTLLGPWIRTINRDFRALDVTPGTLPFSGGGGSGSASEVCREFEAWSAEWFASKAYFALVIVPFVAWTMTPTRLAILFLAVSLVSAAVQSRRRGGGVGTLHPAQGVAIRGFALSLALPAISQIVYAFWCAFDRSQMPHDGPNIVSFGPFAYYVICAGTVALGLAISQRIGRPFTAHPQDGLIASSRLDRWLVIAAGFCFLWPIVSAWVNLLLPGTDGRHWLPF